MKYLLFLFLLSGCRYTNYKVGDCFEYKQWSYPVQVYKVVEVGEYSYKTINKYGYVQVFTSDDWISTQIDCFDIFKEQK